MTRTYEPDFMEWVEIDYDGWHLKPDAPEDVKKKFDAYMKEISMDIVP